MGVKIKKLFFSIVLIGFLGADSFSLSWQFLWSGGRKNSISSVETSLSGSGISLGFSRIEGRISYFLSWNRVEMEGGVSLYQNFLRTDILRTGFRYFFLHPKEYLSLPYFSLAGSLLLWNWKEKVQVNNSDPRQNSYVFISKNERALAPELSLGLILQLSPRLSLNVRSFLLFNKGPENIDPTIQKSPYFSGLDFGVEVKF